MKFDGLPEIVHDADAMTPPALVCAVCGMGPCPAEEGPWDGACVDGSDCDPVPVWDARDAALRHATGVDEPSLTSSDPLAPVSPSTPERQPK